MFERILIVEPDASERERIGLLLADEGYAPVSASNAQDALGLLAMAPTDVVLCNQALPGVDGFDVVPQLARVDPAVAIVLLCGDEAVDGAHQALKRGAYDALALPLERATLRLALRRIEARNRDLGQRRLLERDLLRAIGDRPIVAASEVMIEVLERLESTAAFKAAALLEGEVGTGRESLGRAIHAQSPRRDGPFVAVDCRTRDAQALECALLGQVRSRAQGPRRGQRGLIVEADHGTLYLDHLHALPHGLQARLLRIMEEEAVCPVGGSKSQPIDVRFMAASDDQLAEASQAGRFNPELYARFDAARLRVPPLRERRADIPLLVDHILARNGQAGSPRRMTIDDDALDRLTQYSWPGNLRELECTLQHAAMRTSSDRIGLRELPDEVSLALGSDASGPSADLSLKRARRAFEAQMIRRALHATGGNRTHAARLLEISHRALLYKLKEYGLKD